MNDQIEQAHIFLKSHLYNSKMVLNEIDYRYEHSLRVANIGKRLSVIEGSNERVVVLACLLHDVGKFDTDDNIEHGRVSAKIAKSFLETLELTKTEINDICYAIGVHVDRKCGYHYKDIVEAKIVRDADYIDRFGSSKTRLVISWELNQKPLSINDRVIKTKQALNMYHKLYNNSLETKSGDQWFKEKIKTQINFHNCYLDELKLTLESLY